MSETFTLTDVTAVVHSETPEVEVLSARSLSTVALGHE